VAGHGKEGQDAILRAKSGLAHPERPAIERKKKSVRKRMRTVGGKYRQTRSKQKKKREIWQHSGDKEGGGK